MTEQGRNNADAALRQIREMNVGELAARFERFTETSLYKYVVDLGKSDKRPIGDWSDIADSLGRRRVVNESGEVLSDRDPNDVDADCDVTQFLEPLAPRQGIDI